MTIPAIVFGCVVRSEHCIDILNAESFRKEHLNVFITGFIETTDHRLTDQFPLTNRRTDYLPTDPPTGRHQLTSKLKTRF